MYFHKFLIVILVFLAPLIDAIHNTDSIALVIPNASLNTLSNNVIAMHSSNHRIKPYLKNKHKAVNTPKKKTLRQSLRKVFSPILDPYLSLPIITRLYVTLALSLSALQTAAIIQPELLALHTKSTLLDLELWRPITAMAFFGEFTLSMLSRLYMLMVYSKELETFTGSAQHLILFTYQLIALSGICMAMEIPFFSSAFSASLLYICSRQNPFQAVSTLFGISIPYWQLPFVSILIDVINSQNARSAIPGLMGILIGHTYYFLTQILEEMGGEPYFQAPKRLKEMLDITNELDIDNKKN